MRIDADAWPSEAPTPPPGSSEAPPPTRAAARPKLRVPAPSRADHPHYFGALLALCALCLPIAYGLLRAPAPSEIERAAARLRSLQAPEIARERAWSDAELLAALRSGPPLASEIACRRALARGARFEEADAMRRALRANKAHAARSCLAIALFDGGIADAGLRAEVRDYWARVNETGNEAELAALTEVLSERPAGARAFLDWARACATYPDRPTWAPCLRAVARHPDKRASDPLELAEVILQGATAPERAAALMGRVLRDGFPVVWERAGIGIESARRGAAFGLCRLAHDPRAAAARAAAGALDDAIGQDGVATDEHIARWREACLIAFGGDRPDLRDPDRPRPPRNDVPLLTTELAAEDGSPDPTLRGLAAAGLCAVREGAPWWACGAAAWRGLESRGDALNDLKTAYLDTRYLSWDSWRRARRAP